jgi:hypothetical protein
LPLTSRKPSARMRDCAQQLLAYEAAVPAASSHGLPLLARTLDSLQRPFVVMAGLNSWSMILARALSLAKQQAPQLSGVSVSSEGGLEGYQHRRDEDGATGVILISQMLDLLSAFIGEGATLSILARVWPGVTISDTESSGEN